MEQYDLIVIGAGPGGYLAAERAAEAGLKTLLFEKRSVGGVCLNEGCIPTKTLLHSGKLYSHMQHCQTYGITAGDLTFSHAAVLERKNKVVNTLVSGVSSKLKGKKVTVIAAAATIKGKNETGFLVEAEGVIYHGGKLLLATGSAPVAPAVPGVIEGLESGYIKTNREILSDDTLPKRLVIIGGGVIGLEMASYFAMAGSSVTVIEMLPKIAGPTDSEITGLLLKELQKIGVVFHLSSQVTEVTPDGVSFLTDGRTTTIAADSVLLSIGRSPVTNFGGESIGLYLDKGVVTDHHLRTNIPGVYAVGDVNGKSMLAHTAYREAEAAVNHMTGKRDYMRYEAVPSVIYTAPEAAGVGETEESAKAKGLAFHIKKTSMRYSGRFVAENDREDGLCKMIIEDGSNRLLGVHLIGSYASEIIYGAAMMIESRWPVDDLKELVFPHPTVAEIIRETLFS